MSRPSVAIWKLASCDGCQLTLLDCEQELLAVGAALDIAWFPEAGPAEARSHYDVSLVEGSVTTAEDVERLHDIRARSGILVTIGACATAGGVQALRNDADAEAWTASVYPRPEWIHALATSTPIADHVRVDHELRGCPIAKAELLALLAAVVAGRRPPVTTHSVCVECKAAGTPCLTVVHGTPCLGPVTHAGCGALCPRLGRGCFGCFGPSEAADVIALRQGWRATGVPGEELVPMLRTFNVAAPAFRAGASS
jgi:coenzyme F420-reducing hydrogenase gamma subunit